MSDKIDISPEAVERLAERADVYQFEMGGRTVNVGKTLRALSARLAEVEKRAVAARWNVDETGNLVRLCRGDHDKSENCSDHEEVFVPLARAEAAEAALAKIFDVGKNFHAACVSAWACGEPPHKVRAMLDLADEFDAALRALVGDTTPEPAEHNQHRARGGYTGGV